jgi:RNA polymerase sigma factor (sigma-70 family)
MELGDNQAASQLWDRFATQMSELARRKLRYRLRTMSDEEDVAISAFESLWNGAVNGKFPSIGDRHDLWRLLVVITQRKILDKLNYDHRQKRDVNLVRNLSSAEIDREYMEHLALREATPEMKAEFQDEVQRLLGMLPSDEYRTIALLKTEGFSIFEIANRIGRGHSTIERKLKTIRAIWEEQV